MRLLLSLIIVGAVAFAGGDILPVQVKVEKPQQRGCYKPNIKKCPDCVDVAEICPDDPSLPIAETLPCEGLTKQQEGH